MNKFVISLLSVIFISNSGNRCFFATIDSRDSNSIIDSDANICTKRLWFNVTNEMYINKVNHLILEWKEHEFSQQISYVDMHQLTNYNRGIYYYADVPIECDIIRISAIDEFGVAKISTQWKYYLYNARLHEIYDNSNIIRYRRADVFPPDAFILGNVFSCYFSCSSSYENGYSAYSDLQKYWLSCFSGNVNGTFETVFIYDYHLNLTEINCDTPKSRRVTLKDKIDELKEMYERNKTTGRKSNTKVFFVGLVFLLVSIFISAIISILVIKPKRNIK